MRYIILLLGLLATVPGLTTSATAYPADCLLEVHGKTYIKGVCEFSSRDGGDFQIWGKEGYFAQLSIHAKDKNLAGLTINEGPGSTHAQRYLGDVHRKGACWEGKGLKICARALSAPTRAKIEDSRPHGAMIELQVPGYPTVCLPGNSFEPGVELELANCVGAYGELPKLFKPGIDNILIDKHPGLCIDAKPTAKANLSRLVLEDCKKVTNKWHLFKGAIHSSSKDLCWIIPNLGDHTRLSPFKIMAAPCPDNMDEIPHFEFYKGG